MQHKTDNNSNDDESIDVGCKENDASSYLNQTQNIKTESMKDSHMIYFMRKKSFSEFSKKKNQNNYRRNPKTNNQGSFISKDQQH